LTGRIRPAEPADLEALAWMHHASFVAGNGPHLPPPRLIELTPAAGLERWRRVLAERPTGAALLVLEQAGRLAGTAGAGPNRGEEHVGELYSLYVDPEHWRRGLGTRLHDAALEHLGRAGWSEGILWVLEGNTGAQRFYEFLGWRLDGDRTEVWDAPAVRMRRPV